MRTHTARKIRSKDPSTVRMRTQERRPLDFHISHRDRRKKINDWNNENYPQKQKTAEEESRLQTLEHEYPVNLVDVNKTITAVIKNSMFLMNMLKHWLSKCGPEQNVAEESPVEQLRNAHHSHFLPWAAEMNGDETDSFWLLCRIGCTQANVAPLLPHPSCKNTERCTWAEMLNACTCN